MKYLGHYIVSGQMEIGQQFGYSGHELKAGEFAVVHDGEYTDGGFGPIVSAGPFESLAAAWTSLNTILKSQIDDDRRRRIARRIADRSHKLRDLSQLLALASAAGTNIE